MHIRNEEFRRMKDYMYKQFGINLEGKLSLIEGRMSTILEQRGFTSFDEYMDLLFSDTTGAEISLVVSKLTTNYTYFMREEQHYQFLEKTALPELVPKIKDHDLRIWSAGCSSGEEAFTTSMQLMEYFGMQRGQWDTSILATDISENVLSIARKGIYTEDKLRQLPSAWIQRYFKKLDATNYQISDELRKQVTFAHFNLMEKTFPFKRKFHVIFCRNVMIYFDNPVRQALSERFYNALEKGGYLFIGLSETMSNMNTRFEYVKPAIYRKGN